MRHRRKDWTEPGLTVLQQVLRYQGLSVLHLSKATRIAESTMARVLGGHLPSLPHALRIARYLKVRVEDLWQ